VIRAVLFDLDGTLLDTAPDLIAALNFLRQAEGLPMVEEAGYRHFVSRGALGLISAGMPESTEDVFEHRKAEFLRHYEQNLFVKTKPFKGVNGLLNELEARAIPWGIVTNKMEYLTFPLLEAVKLLGRATCVICGDTLQQSKPHPAPVLLACEVLGASCKESLMIGDDLRDLHAGEAAGTKTALACYGYLDPEIRKRDLSSSYMIDKPEDVLKILDNEMSFS